METSTIRELVAIHSPSPTAIWPNGLGYSWRGWEYSVRSSGWVARRGDLIGYGDSPLDARCSAYQRTGKVVSQ